MKSLYILFLASSLSLSSCEKLYETDNNPIIYGETYLKLNINTDKAVYAPGSQVQFTLKEMPSGNYKVRYSHLGEVLKEENLTSTTWTWTVPQDDFKGYLVEIYQTVEGKDNTYGSIAVDVSSDWKKFPRYGFLSSYGEISSEQIEKNIEFLTRCHINGLQFYDWMYDHHKPLAGTVSNPLASWPDLMGRTNYLSTVRNYIQAAKSKNMKTMFYNLAFGALENAAADGVSEQWYMFKDASHSDKDRHELPIPPFRSNIYLTNPANVQWQNYLASRHNDVYSVFDFDGFHIDQLGSRGTVYDYQGNVLRLDQLYASFINAMKQSNPNKRLVMNAVSQFGQEGVASTDVDFLYSEVWNETKTFAQLAQVILDNDKYSNYQKKTLLAAYMNYEKSKSAGYVNEYGVLLADAVIFAFGGAHLELGEHYLANEYFPNANLQMKASLKKNLITYYDFLVAYQNLLRDGGNFITKEVSTTNNSATVENWPASQGKIACVAKDVNGKEVLHFINFNNANSMEWRDAYGTQTEPNVVNNLTLKIKNSRLAQNVWFASPDFYGGTPKKLDFVQVNDELIITLPSLKYWDMVVIEY